MSSILKLPDQTMPKFASYPFLYTFASLYLIFFLIKLYTRTITTTKNQPPSPPKLPIIGNLHQIGPLLHRSFLSLAKRYGGPLMLIQLGSVPALVVSSADAAREIMKTQDLVFANRPDLRLWRRLLYDQKEVSVAPYGEYWRQVKSIITLQLLSNKRVQSYREVREEEVAIAVKKIKESSLAKQVVDLSDLFVMFTNDVICMITFGRKYSEGENGRKFRKMLKEFFDLLGGLNLEDLIPQLTWVDRMRGLDARVDRLAKELDEFFEGVIEERLAKMDSGEADTLGERREDFIDILLKIQKDDKLGISLERVSVKALLLDAYTAGTDTTATVLEWTMTELLKHPTIMKKVQNEVRTILNGKQHITDEDVAKMKYLKAVIKETLRLHPPIPTLVPRVASQDVKVMGYDVAKGTRVFINAWAIARDPKLWDAPEEFRPERLLDSSIDYKGHDFELIPFGAGRRGCPGISFAMATNENVIANLLHRFDWKLPSGEKEEELDMKERPGLTIRKRTPLLAIATPYSP